MVWSVVERGGDGRSRESKDYLRSTTIFRSVSSDRIRLLNVLLLVGRDKGGLEGIDGTDFHVNVVSWIAVFVPDGWNLTIWCVLEVLRDQKQAEGQETGEKTFWNGGLD